MSRNVSSTASAVVTRKNTMNSGVYPSEWATALQERLNKPTNWKEFAQVIYSNTKIFNFPYMSTEFSTQTGTRGSSYSFSDFALTTDTVDIATIELEPVFIDRADLAQCTLNTIVDIATRQGDHLSEEIEAGVLADHGSWTNFDAGTLATGTASTVAITVSSSNIDDIIRKMKTKIGEANGQALADRDGMFIVWRYADLEELEKFAQARQIIGLFKSFLIDLEARIQRATGGKQSLVGCAA